MVSVVNAPGAERTCAWQDRSGMARAASPIADTLIDDLVDQFPGVIAAFVERRMHCVGCPMARFETVAEACEIYQLPLDSFLADLASRTADCRSDVEFS